MRSDITITTTATKAASRQSRGDSVHQVILIGRLVAWPDPRETPSGEHVTTVPIAVQAGSHPDFFDVVLWGQMADFATRYLTKGRLVYGAGKLSSRQWRAATGSSRRDRRDRRQPTPSALQEERSGYPGGITPGRIPGEVH